MDSGSPVQIPGPPSQEALELRRLEDHIIPYIFTTGITSAVIFLAVENGLTVGQGHGEALSR
jgi:hypothetical protein